MLGRSIEIWKELGEPVCCMENESCAKKKEHVYSSHKPCFGTAGFGLVPLYLGKGCGQGQLWGPG